MGIYWFHRVRSALLLIVLVSFFSFLVLMMLPGDPVQLMLGMEAPPEVAEELRAQLGFDKPWYVQYGEWIWNLIHGDLGVSILYGQPVSALILERIPLTLSITLLSLALSLLLALPLGIISAVKKGSWADKMIQWLVQIGLAVPNFWVGILFILFFAVHLKILPPSGYTPITEGLIPHLTSILLPCSSLALAEAAVLIRMIRASLLEVLDRDYMTFARTKGLSRFRRYTHYALRNSLIGPITLLGFQVMNLLGGVIVIENIFALPGLGRLLLIAVRQRDLILVQGLVIVLTFTVILINLLLDLLYTLIDPRIKLQAERNGSR
ncbi:putative peptide transport system permease protein BAB2_1050 [[Clostridium] ultunense Esp]|nr:putative peptide transport system permease protein BAB2_1050 [[Clostridium] ultunense Esp]